MHVYSLVLLLLCFVRESSSSAGVVTTLIGYCSGDGGAATSANTATTTGVAIDSSGNIYFSSSNDCKIRKVTAAGTISSVVGSGIGLGTSGSIDGSGTSASINTAYGLALDSSGNVYIADTGNSKIRKLTVSTGIVSTYACNGYVAAGTNNVAATSTSCYYPFAVALDSSNNVYVADTYQNQVRKITASTTIITAFAGTGRAGFSGDGGAATAATLYYPSGAAVDTSGNVYFTDRVYNLVRKVTVSTGIISTIAGSGSGGYSGDNGPATSAQLYNPFGVAVDSSGNVYIGDTWNQRVRKVTETTGIITTFAGSATSTGTGAGSYSGDGGAATSAELWNPFGVAFDTSGNLYIGDMYNHRTRKVAKSTGIISTVAGHTIDSSQSTSVSLSLPEGVAIDSSGNVYVSEYSGHKVKKMTVTTGLVSDIAGSGASSSSGDGAAAMSAGVYAPSGVALDAAGNVYIAETLGNKIRKLTVSTGLISTMVGTGSAGRCSSGLVATSTACLVNSPVGIEVDSSGNVYYSDTANNKVKKYTVTTGIVTDIAGSGSSSTSGDGSSATNAGIYKPYGFIFDVAGNIIISEYGSHKVRKVTVSTGVISTIAGTGTSGYSGDAGQASSATLNNPADVAIDSFGDIYISDSSNNKIRKVTVSTGIISTIAGSSTSGGYTGNNVQGTSATFNTPFAIAIDSANNVYVTDASNSAVRKIEGITSSPSYVPSQYPSVLGTKSPTIAPNTITSRLPSLPPTVVPSSVPSLPPTVVPSSVPSLPPTVVPSSVPSSLQNTIEPSCTPTSMLPTATPTTSAYPTYTSTVHVYFLVAHVLSGISATTYSSNRAANDAVFKQAVVSMVGYDSKVEDVSIQLVTDAVPSRPLSAATAETKLVYSISTPTRIFNDSNQATGLFIKALNESIITGSFDALLETTGSTDWKSVTTDYVIFSIPSPTFSPSLTPTSSPMKIDKAATNLFDATLTDDVAKAKIKYYLGAFVAYFIVLYISLYAYSLLRYGKITAVKLYDTSYQSESYVRHCTITKGSSKSSELLLSDLYTRNNLVQRTIELEKELNSVKAVTRKSRPESSNTENSTSKSPSGKRSIYSVSVSEKFDSIFMSDEENKYSKGYREYVQQQRTLLGCSPIMYPNGYIVKVPCTSREIHLPPSRIEDLLLFLCHNHPLFSCFYFMEGSKLGAHGTRILYIGKDIAVFVLYQFSNMLLQYHMLDGHGLGTFINLFIITPSAVSIGLLLKYLYTCPFTETVDFQRRYAKYQSIVLLLGRLAIIPIMIIMVSSLIIACLFSCNSHILMIIVDYFIYVQFYGVLLSAVKTMLLFVDGYYYQLSVFGVLEILCIGRLYKERIMAEQLVVDVDYAYRTSSLLFGLLNAQTILNRDDAIKAKWISESIGGECAIEIRGRNIISYDDFVVQNPLTKLVNQTDSLSVTIVDEAVSHQSENDDGEGIRGLESYRDWYRNDTSATISDDTEVSVHKLITDTSNQNVSNNNNKQESTRLQPNGRASAGDDDAALFLEYQSLQSQLDDAAYDMSDMTTDERSITFEEWKIKTKQFKQGTRGSFVKAFQVFEEREQKSLGDVATPSPSVRNTMHLHKATVKNVLLARKSANPMKKSAFD